CGQRARADAAPRARGRAGARRHRRAAAVRGAARNGRLMRTYVGITGFVFAWIFAAHVARVWAEGTWLLREPLFILTTAASLGAAICAVFLLSGRRRSS